MAGDLYLENFLAGMTVAELTTLFGHLDAAKKENKWPHALGRGLIEHRECNNMDEVFSHVGLVITHCRPEVLSVYQTRMHKLNGGNVVGLAKEQRFQHTNLV